MTKRSAQTAAAFAAMGLLLAACGSDSSAADGSDGGGETRSIDTQLGVVDIPDDPQAVAVLDNTSAETVFAMTSEVVAVPHQLFQNVVPEWSEDADLADAGSHREPQLEQVNAAEPDLIIGGNRFVEYQSDLESIAPTIDVAPRDEEEGQYVDDLIEQTETLGEVFGEEDIATQLIDDYEAARDAAIEASDGETVFLAVVSGGNIDNGAGRIGRIIEPLEMTDVFGSEDLDAESVHQDSGIAPETVAQTNPDWLIVMDRDAATSEPGEGSGTEAAESIVNAQEAWSETTFAQEDNILYLPGNFYVRESIQAYTEVYEQIAEVLSQP